MNKLFIIGLPRTGTTSISAALLEHYNVAHTAYTKRAFELADVISDCPCFSDYPQLDQLFPDSKFVYLQRSLELWRPSMQRLLNKIQPTFDSGNYVNPILKRSFTDTFALESVDNPTSHEHLTTCYNKHQRKVEEYFKDREDLLSIDISHPDSLTKLHTFLALPKPEQPLFPHLNIGKRVDNWKEIKSPNKVNPTAAGTEGRKFFRY